MKYILDSDILSYLYDPKSTIYTSVRERFTNLQDEDRIQVSLITIFELEYSIYNAPEIKKDQLTKQLRDVEQRFEVVPITRRFASIYGEIKALIRKSRGTTTKGMRKYNIDLIVASTALTESSVLVANDDIYQSLQEIYPQFQYENWTI